MNDPKSGMIDEQNMALFVDYYELTMGKADLDHENTATVTENYFVRKVPYGEYLIVAGLEQVAHYILNLKFTKEDLEWMKTTSGRDFSKEFIDYLENFRFQGDLWAVPEGIPVFPNEPIINVTGKTIDVQLFETYLLNVMNFQSLIATKASRIVNAAGGRTVLDFGSRRAHGRDAALLGARAAYIAGITGTSNVLAGKLFGIPYVGTMAHKFVQDRKSEIDAFREYAESFPHNTILLIDTYDTIQGAKNACRIAKELEKKGYRLRGVRLDSGDLLKLSKEVREILNENKLGYVKIFVSGDLDEFLIDKLIREGAPIDGFGVGTRLITGANYNPITNEGGVSAMPGVYKLVERVEDGQKFSKYKISDDKEKTTLPGRKQVYRIYDNYGMYKKDVITLFDEKIDGEPLLVPIIKEGNLVYDFPDTKWIRERYLQEIKKLPEQYKALIGAARYPVELSTKLSKLSKRVRNSFLSSC